MTDADAGRLSDEDWPLYSVTVEPAGSRWHVYRNQTLIGDYAHWWDAQELSEMFRGTIAAVKASRLLGIPLPDDETPAQPRTYYDREGCPLTEDERIALGHNVPIASDWVEVGDHLVQVITEWHGVDRRLPGDDRPLIFETNVFGDGPLADECPQYATEAEALAGHRAMCERARRTTTTSEEQE